MGINHYKKSISSGIRTSSVVILEGEGWLNGAILTNGSVDSKVFFYDSADADLGDKRVVGFVSNEVPSFDYAVHCVNGIYAEIEEGAEFLCLFDK